MTAVIEKRRKAGQVWDILAQKWPGNIQTLPYVPDGKDWKDKVETLPYVPDGRDWKDNLQTLPYRY